MYASKIIICGGSVLYVQMLLAMDDVLRNRQTTDAILYVNALRLRIEYALATKRFAAISDAPNIIFLITDLKTGISFLIFSLNLNINRNKY